MNARRGRLGFAILVSLLFHALLLSLGFAGHGLAGFSLPWQQRWAQASDLRVVLMRSAAAAPEPRPVSPPPARTELAPVPVDAQPVGEVLRPPVPQVAVIALEHAQDPAFVVPPPLAGTNPPGTESRLQPPRAEESAPVRDRTETPAAVYQDEGRAEREAQRLARQREADRREAERLATATQEARKLDEARQAEARAAADRLAAERIEAERRAAAQREEQKQQEARLATARAEADRQAAERQQAQAREAERQAAANLEAQRREAQRIEAEKLAAARLSAQRQEEARLAAVRAETQRLAAAQLEARKQEEARVAAQLRESERLAAARLEAQRQERDAAARAETERQAAERAQKQQREALNREAARQAAAGLEAQKRELIRIESERLAAAQRSAQEEDERREARRRAMGRQLDEEAARRDAVAAGARERLPLSLSTARRARLWGRADPNTELVHYAEAWARKIQLNTPVETVRELAKRPHTQPMVTVALRSDGSVESISFVLSSGSAIVDEAIHSIVQSHAPYPAFPPGLSRLYDVIEIRRTWQFDSAVRLY